MVTRKWWKENEAAIAAAVDAAERASGHQILVRVGRLGRRSDRIADRIAMKWPAASLVFCVDPARRRYEVRWSAGSALDAAAVDGAVTAPLRDNDLARAIGALAALLPPRAEGEEIPDVVVE